jgi:glycosyltransferase involved in cell wall biosynthesis
MKLAYIIGTYPSLTTTFIDREIQALRARNVELEIISIRRASQGEPAANVDLQRGVRYLLPVSVFAVIGSHLHFAFSRPAIYFGTLVYLITRPHPNVRSTGITFLHFAEGVCVAQMLVRRSCDHLHAHFMDRASTVALIAGRLLRLSYSLTAHAADIYVSPVLAKEKLSHAAFVATCTEYNRAVLAQLMENGSRDKLKCIYHGLDLAHYQPVRHLRTGKATLLCVAQLKEKKGISFLVEACRLLKGDGYEFECHIVGEGPLHEALQEQICRSSLEDIVTLHGALPHEQVIQKYSEADVFVLPSIVGSNGDRDGIPNVILEAMAMQLPVISTRHSGIPEVLEDGVNGLLVTPADVRELAHALHYLLDHPEVGRQMGGQGRQTVARKFDLESNAGRLFKEFQQAIAEEALHA